MSANENRLHCRLIHKYWFISVIWERIVLFSVIIRDSLRAKKRREIEFFDDGQDGKF